MTRGNDLERITVAHMEVPCCTGILRVVLEACHRAGGDVVINDVMVSRRGEAIARPRVTADPPL